MNSMCACSTVWLGLQASGADYALLTGPYMGYVQGQSSFWNPYQTQVLLFTFRLKVAAIVVVVPAFTLILECEVDNQAS